MSKRGTIWLGLVALGFLAAACTQEATADDPQVDAPAGGVVGPRIVSPVNGEVFDGPVTIQINMGTLDPGTNTVPGDAGGGFHLMVNEECVANGEKVDVMSAGHRGFMDGSTSMTMNFEPGAYDLCVQFLNGEDLAYYATDSVTIRVAD